MDRVPAFRLLLSVSISMVTSQGYVPPTCPKQCPPGGFLNKDNQCCQMANLLESCGPTRLCEPAYSECRGGKCQCLPGFQNKNLHCYPTTYTCPGQPPLSNAKMCLVDVDECDGPIQGRGVGTGYDGPNFGSRCLQPLDEVLMLSDSAMHTAKMSGAALGRFKRHIGNQKVTYKYNGGCADDEVCTITSGFQASRCHAFGVGHCCKQTCPLGSPHPQASCKKGHYLPCSGISGYSCHRGYLTPGAVEAFGELIDQFFPATCCPTHCPPGTTTTDVGHCYPIAKGLDHGCWRSEQCYDRECVRGQCDCGEGEARVVFPGGGEACVNATQNTGPGLGQPCTDICGVRNAKCTAGVCACGCGYQKFRDRCIRKAEGCPKSDANYSCSFWAKGGECDNNPNWMVKNCPYACGICVRLYSPTG